jgi:hypothetical protein
MTHSLFRVRVRVRVTLRLAVYRQSVRLGTEPLETHGQNLFSQLNTCCHSPYITSSRKRGWFSHLQLLLALGSAFILGSNSSGLATIFYCLRFETCLFVDSYDSQGYSGSNRTRLHTGIRSAGTIQTIHMPQILILQQPNYTIHTSQAATTNTAPTQTVNFLEAENRTDSDDRLSRQEVGGRVK